MIFSLIFLCKNCSLPVVADLLFMLICSFLLVMMQTSLVCYWSVNVLQRYWSQHAVSTLPYVPLLFSYRHWKICRVFTFSLLRSFFFMFADKVKLLFVLGLQRGPAFISELLTVIPNAHYFKRGTYDLKKVLVNTYYSLNFSPKSK